MEAENQKKIVSGLREITRASTRSMLYPSSAAPKVTKITRKKNNHIAPQITYLETQNVDEDEATKFMEKGVFTEDFEASEMPVDDEKASVKPSEPENFEQYEYLDDDVDAQQLVQDNQSNLKIDVPNTQVLESVSMEQAQDFFKKLLSEMSRMAKELKNLKSEVVNLREMSNNRINELKEQINNLTERAGTTVAVAEESAKQTDLISQVPSITVEDSKMIKNFIITKSSTPQQLVDEMRELESASERTKMKHVSIFSISYRYLFESYC